MQAKWSLENLILKSEITNKTKEDIKAAPTNGIYIHGLFLEAASWNKKNGILVESKPKVLFEQMPVIFLTASTHENQLKNKYYQYHCPIYKKPKRTDLNFITAINLPSKDPPKNWILKGTCLLCDNK